MKLIWVAAASAAFTPSFVEAIVSTFSQTGCVTRQSTKSTNKISTSTTSYTLTFNPEVTVLTTSTKTIIPLSTTVTAVTTSTSTVTEILSQVTDTATVTTTDTETAFATTTLISTRLTTLTDVVTSSGTLTIPASAGFTPLASQLAAQGYTVGTVSKRSAKRRISQVQDNVDARLKRSAGPDKSAPQSSSKQYPVAVSCYRFVQIISISTVTSTAKTAQTITAIPGTITVTSTTVEPTTTTSIPFDASVIVTESATTTITDTATQASTTTFTMTSVSTAFEATATFYAACGTDNQVSSVNGHELYDVGADIPAAVTNAASAYDCCVLCLQSDKCASSVFSPTTGNYCGLYPGSGTCDPTQDTINLYATGDSGRYAVASNSNCGRASSNILGL